jgi:hypothetical protein
MQDTNWKKMAQNSVKLNNYRGNKEKGREEEVNRIVSGNSLVICMQRVAKLFNTYTVTTYL